MLFLLVSFQASAQAEDAAQLKRIYEAALTKGKAYDWLNHLSNQIGKRLSSSVQTQQAIDYTKAQMDSLSLDKV